MESNFQIAVEPSVLSDLKRRLAATCWPDEVDNADWQYGTNETYLRELCTYWQHSFDWQKQQDYLNSFSHFKTTVDGTGLHYLHHKGQGTNSLPLLLTHGWPDSFVRFLKIIPLLTQADAHGFAFDVVVPSIPGHGFSAIPTKPGMNNRQIAKLFASLMTEELGYKKFLAHGGDAGSEITEQLGLYHADALLGIHLTDIPYHHIIVADEARLSSAEKAYKAEVTKWQQTEGAYNMIQSTRPQTLAYGLNDSPTGLAAWIIEKFYKWSDCHGNLESCFTKDELLTNITIYWATHTINSSFRRYHETMQDIAREMFNPLAKLNPFDRTGSKIKVPTAVAQFKTDLLPPKDFANRFFAIQRWTKMPAGGHFTAMEQPQLLASDIRAFADELEIKP
ncbi:epoxide hydrolase family protein [Hymenobacter cheonanensis]|uniref:epoxide hydrolase family protein n=1 Tax=Hymenobacter sp. CA2-7 TaxID=3063993 RepID=UPI002712AC77|nr:epoxide hydrolase family protein [Hymenobacter sp. CA2-7]MDO7887120.1 epoxide hydrolase [Hymenobacter sp. CA2-7]